MKRLTREKDEYECRLAGGCPAEEWMSDIYGKYPPKDTCETCPFEKYINVLATYEDEEEISTSISAIIRGREQL